MKTLHQTYSNNRVTLIISLGYHRYIVSHWYLCRQKGQSLRWNEIFKGGNTDLKVALPGQRKIVPTKGNVAAVGNQSNKMPVKEFADSVDILSC